MLHMESKVIVLNILYYLATPDHGRTVCNNYAGISHTMLPLSFGRL